MLAAAWPLEPILGQVFRGFAYDGRQWRKARGAEWSNVQVFKTSGRYTPSEDLLYVIVECFGAGGGGGWCQRLPAAISGFAGAGGGGSGGYSRKTLPAELVIQGADVVVAPGLTLGAGQAGGAYAVDTSFGGLVIAKGGQNANAYDGAGSIPGQSQFGQPGQGAPVGTGDVTLPGACGYPFTVLAQWQADGTPTFFPQAGLGGTLFGGNVKIPDQQIGQQQNGMNGVPNSGAGGGGGQAGSGTPAFGGTGGSGLCVVTEICGTENGGPEPPITPPSGWPPGVPFRVDVRARVVHDPNPPTPEPVK